MLRNPLTTLINANNKALKKLPPYEQKELISSINYMRAKGLGICDSEILRKDLIGICLENHLRGKQDETMNSKGFCEDLLSSYTKPKYEPFIYIVYQFSITSLLYAIMQILIYPEVTPISFALLYVYILFFIFQYLSVYFLPRFNLSSLITHTLSYGITAIIIIFSIILLYFNRTQIHVWAYLNSSLIIFLHLLFYLASSLIWNVYVKRSIKNNKMLNLL